MLAVFFAEPLGARQEDLQTWLFPVSLSSFWFIPKLRSHRLPLTLLGLATIFWGTSTLHARGYLGSPNGSGKFLISRLTDDIKSEDAGALYRRVNQVTSTYELPRFSFLEREFDSADKALNWLEGKSNTKLVVSGSSEWLSLNFGSALFGNARANGKVSKRADHLFTEADASLSKKVSIEGSEFLLVASTRQIKVPTRPFALSKHYLAWFGQVVHAEDSETMEDALIELTMLKGNWRSPEPLGTAEALLGTHYLVEALQAGQLSAGFLDCSLARFRKAAGLLTYNWEAEAYALTFNNAAIALLAKEGVKEGYSRAVNWFQRATRAVSKRHNGRPPPGARIAFQNLATLERLR